MRIQCFIHNSEGTLLLVKNLRHHPVGYYTGIPAETSPTTTPEEEASLAAKALGLEVHPEAWRAGPAIQTGAGPLLPLFATAPLGLGQPAGNLYPLFFRVGADLRREPLTQECRECLRASTSPAQ